MIHHNDLIYDNTTKAVGRLHAHEAAPYGFCYFETISRGEEGSLDIDLRNSKDVTKMDYETNGVTFPILMLLLSVQGKG